MIGIEQLRLEILTGLPEPLVNILVNDDEYKKVENGLIETLNEWKEAEKTNTNTKLLKRKYNKFIMWQIKTFLPCISTRILKEYNNKK